MTLETFFDKFDQFADAPGAVAKMRDVICVWATTGQLSKKEPTDDDAEALKNILSEWKQQVVNEGRAKSSKAEKKISPALTIPDHWIWSTVGESLAVCYGKGLSTKELTADGYPVFGANGIIGCYSDYTYSSRQLLISCRGAYSGKPNISPSNCFITSNTLVLELPDSLDTMKDFLHLYFQGIDKTKIVTGSAQPQVTIMNLEPFPVPIPPLAEQKRIVAKVDELMALCDRLEAQQQERDTRHADLARASLARFAEAPTPANLHFLFHKSYPIPPADLRKSILTLAVQGKLVPQDPNDEPAASLISQIAEEKRHLVAARIIRDKDEAAPITDDELPFEVPYGWEWARLSSITRRIHYGYTASARSELKDVRLLRITDIQNNSVDWSSVPGCEIAKDDVAQYQLERSDILVARTGGTVGKTYLVQDVPVVAVFASYLIRIQGGSALFDRYLKLFLESPTYWVQLEEGARGAAQPNVNGQTLGRMVVSVPPHAEQRRIVAKVDQLMALVDELETQLAASRASAANLLNALVAELTTE